MSPGRTLPLRVPIMAGEALDSWLEALARRSQVTVGTLVTALGWRMPSSPGGLVAGIPAQVLRRLEHLAVLGCFGNIAAAQVAKSDPDG